MRRVLLLLVVAGCSVVGAAACHEDPPIVTAATAGTAPVGDDDHDAGGDAARGPDAIADAASDRSLDDMFGEEIGESVGAGGLGLSGMGEACIDGGRPGEGIGLGNFGGLQHGAGVGVCGGDGGSTGTGFGLGSHPDGGLLGRTHAVSAQRIREANVVVTGSVPVEVVRRIVRQNFGRFRLCYATSVAATPTIAGMVSVRFEIDPTGAPANAQNDGSSIPDPTMVSCVITAFTNLRFPPPTAGETVRYALDFAPGP